MKPSNVLLDHSGSVKLCDFGISGRLVDSKAKTRSAGCAAYMAVSLISNKLVPPRDTSIVNGLKMYCLSVLLTNRVLMFFSSISGMHAWRLGQKSKRKKQGSVTYSTD